MCIISQRSPIHKTSVPCLFEPKPQRTPCWIDHAQVFFFTFPSIFHVWENIRVFHENLFLATPQPNVVVDLENCIFCLRCSFVFFLLCFYSRLASGAEVWTGGVSRSHGARDKKQVWRPRVRTWDLLGVNVLYVKKYLRHRWDFSTPSGIYPPPLPPSLRPWVRSSFLFFFVASANDPRSFQRTHVATLYSFPQSPARYEPPPQTVQATSITLRFLFSLPFLHTVLVVFIFLAFRFSRARRFLCRGDVVVEKVARGIAWTPIDRAAAKGCEAPTTHVRSEFKRWRQHWIRSFRQEAFPHQTEMLNGNCNDT